MIESNIKLSIVTITFNDIAGLRETHNSLASQLNSNFEWIVIDGGSVDGTVDFVRSLTQPLSFITEPDRGIYDAMHKGLLAAKGKYLLFLNSGDLLHSNDAIAYINLLLSDCDVYFLSTLMVGNNFSALRPPRPLGAAIYSVPAVQQSTIYKTSILKELEWPLECKICGDYSIAAQLLAKNSSYSISNFILSKFALGGVSTQRFYLLAKEAYLIQRKYLKVSIPHAAFMFVRRVVVGNIVYFANKYTLFGRVQKRF